MFSNASHELRTPLNAIISNADFSEKRIIFLLSQANLSSFDLKDHLEWLLRYVKSIKVSSWLNLSYVNDILDLHRFEKEGF